MILQKEETVQIVRRLFMANDLCSIKGTREGLVITIADSSRFPKVLKSLERQLSSAQSFFAGASAKVLLKEGALDEAQMDRLEQLLAAFEMRLNREPITIKAPAFETGRPDVHRQRGFQEDNTLLVRRTIRSGQSLHYDGNVVVLGDVNPGAEIVCTGDILVLGSLRGVAHAGADGEIDATVFAFRLEPTQLRIAHLISRSPDEKHVRPGAPEIARVVENMIQVSLYSH